MALYYRIDYRLHTAVISSSQTSWSITLLQSPQYPLYAPSDHMIRRYWHSVTDVMILTGECRNYSHAQYLLYLCMRSLPSSRLIIRWINPESSIKLRNSPPIPLSLSKLTEIFTGNSIWQLILMVIFLLEFLSKTLRRIHLYIQSVNKLKITSIFSFRSKGVKFLNFISNWCDEPRQIPCRCHIHCPYKKHIPGPGYLILFFL